MEPLHYLLMKTHSNVNRRILAEAAGLGLSLGQPKILECLMECGEINQKSIAVRCEIEPATVGSVLTRMERDGLVCRTRHEDNRRSIFVTLTPKGRQQGERMQKIFDRADQEAVKGLSKEETQQLCALLERVCRTVTADGKEE